MTVIVTNQIPVDFSVTDGTHTVATVTEIMVQNATVSNAGNGTANVDGLAPLASPTFTGTVTVPELTVSGLTGATAPSRYVGATTSGAPTTGTFAVGDFVIDQSGAVWVCTTAGTPGTWTKIGGGMNYALFTASGTWNVPAGVTTIRCRVIGGGGGGGGGGSATTSTGTGNGGGGGAPGFPFDLVVPLVASDTTLTIAIGSGGVGGTGAVAAGGNGNQPGGNGGQTTVTGTQSGTVYVLSAGGYHGGDTTTTPGTFGNTPAGSLGNGGTGGPANGIANGGGDSSVPYLFVVGGGGGGSTNGSTSGGGAGGAQQSGTSLGTANGGAGQAITSGQGAAGETATLPGCGGGGGGGSIDTLAGGNGGAGAPGQVEIWY